jgi:hypothetical protein
MERKHQDDRNGFATRCGGTAGGNRGRSQEKRLQRKLCRDLPNSILKIYLVKSKTGLETSREISNIQQILFIFSSPTSNILVCRSDGFLYPTNRHFRNRSIRFDGIITVAPAKTFLRNLIFFLDFLFFLL